MSGQRRWLKVWARTVGMPVGISDEDKPEFLPITQTDVKKSPSIPHFLDHTTRTNMRYDYCRQWKVAWLVVK